MSDQFFQRMKQETSPTILYEDELRAEHGDENYDYVMTVLKPNPNLKKGSDLQDDKKCMLATYKAIVESKPKKSNQIKYCSNKRW